MEKSIWEKSCSMPEKPRLEGDKTTDVLIIGAGITGILCAHALKQAGINCTVAEMYRACRGTTGRTTAKITALHGLIYADLIKKSGFKAAEKFYKISAAAIDGYGELSKSIDCDFKRSTAYTYTLNSPDKIKAEYDALRSLGAPSEHFRDLQLPFGTVSAVGLKNQAQFNPLKLLPELSRNLEIYENTKITDFTSGTAFYERGKIKADKIIVTARFPFVDRRGLYFLKMHQQRSYCFALKNAPFPDGMYIDEAEGGYSFRKYRDFLILGGGGGRTGKKLGGYEALEIFRKKYFPKSEIIAKWAAQDCVSLDKLPYIGAYSPNMPMVYVATGFCKWGMTSAMAAAMVLRDEITGVKNEFADIFDPARSILKPSLVTNGLESAAGYLYPSVKSCPHLGCALKYNEAEGTWDCPCHGSRFTKNGRVIDTPAVKDLK